MLETAMNKPDKAWNNLNRNSQNAREHCVDGHRPLTLQSLELLPPQARWP
jgi:hypothetical protein